MEGVASELSFEDRYSFDGFWKSWKKPSQSWLFTKCALTVKQPWERRNEGILSKGSSWHVPTARGSGHRLLGCSSITLLTPCRQEGTCWNVAKLGWSRGLMPAFDLPHLGKQWQPPDISFCSLPGNFTDAKDHSSFLLFPKDDACHLSSATEACSPGPPETCLRCAAPPSDGEQRGPVTELGSLHSTWAQQPSLTSNYAICSWNAPPQPRSTCLLANKSSQQPPYMGQMSKGQDETYFNRLSRDHCGLER